MTEVNGRMNDHDGEQAGKAWPRAQRLLDELAAFRRRLQDDPDLAYVEAAARRANAEGTSLCDGAGAGENRFVVPDAAIDLFERLHRLFFIDQVFEAATTLEQPGEEAAAHLRALIVAGMVEMEERDDEIRFWKTGYEPFF